MKLFGMEITLSEFCIKSMHWRGMKAFWLALSGSISVDYEIAGRVK